MTHGIIASLGGEIRASSQVGKGAVFTIRLPPAGPVQALAVADPTFEPTARPGVARRILVIDDEPLLAKAIADVLEHDTVISAGNGAAALDRLRNDDRFDAILCDVTMPRMNGIELAAAIDRDCPGLARRVVFMTGGALPSEAADYVARTNREVLRKPFTAQRLRAALERVCSSQRSV